MRWTQASLITCAGAVLSLRTAIAAPAPTLLARVYSRQIGSTRPVNGPCVPVDNGTKQFCTIDYSAKVYCDATTKIWTTHDDLKCATGTKCSYMAGDNLVSRPICAYVASSSDVTLTVHLLQVRC